MNVVIVIDQDWKRIEIFSTMAKAVAWINDMANQHNETWLIHTTQAELDPPVPL